MISWIAEIKCDLLCWFSIKPSFTWRMGDTVNIKFTVGFIFLTIDSIECKLSIMSSTESINFLNFWLGTLWQFATIFFDSMSWYNQDVPSVIMTCVLFAKDLFVSSEASFNCWICCFFEGELNWECASKQCQRSSNKKMSFC